MLQVQLNELLGWARAIAVGPSGFLYFVDKKGQLATHPNLPSEGQLVNYLQPRSFKKSFEDKPVSS
jgi:hypothetical protein